jgi:hypothetical protein
MAAATAWAATSAVAGEPVLNAMGQSGGLVIPYAFTLPDGVAEAQYNDYVDPKYGKALRSQVSWGAIGLFPYVELDAGLANYPANVPAPKGEEHFLFRHLSANVKVEVPKFFEYQPSIAFGINDVGGQTHYFRSTYGVVSQTFGPATFTAGYGHGDRLDGAFGGVQLALWQTGLSLLAEDDAKTPYAGVRYQSPSISWLADASVVGTVMRGLRSTYGYTPRTSFSIGVEIPLGRRFTAARCDSGECQGPTMPPANNAITVPADVAAKAIPAKLTLGQKSDDAPSQEAAPVKIKTSNLADAEMQDTALTSANLAAPQKIATTQAAVDTPAVATVLPQAANVPVDDPLTLVEIARHLFAAGLERVQVGVSGHDLIVKYENHRYDQNEADAIGIVFGIVAAEAPKGIERIHAVIKKDDEVLGDVSVDRAAYSQFLRDEASTGLAASLRMSTTPTFDDASITWYGNERAHGLLRFQVSPITSYLYGTEYGNFDISLGANLGVYMPLWTGAEFYANFVAPVYNTKNMDAGRIFAAYRLRGGIENVALAQSFWIAPQIFNTAEVGKFDYEYVGIENETTAFVPWHSDIVRLRLAYLHHEPGAAALPSEKNAELSYRWVQPSWKVWVEAGVARFVGGDKGPTLSVTRWFDDVAVTLHGEHSGEGSYAGITLAVPLTPRQGMKPNYVQLYGTPQFSMDFRTRVHSTNFIAGNADENLTFAYEAQKNLFNLGRFSAEYFATQLYRMRDAYWRYAAPTDGAAPAVKAVNSVSQSASAL